jgi:hypothetical protein
VKNTYVDELFLKKREKLLLFLNSGFTSANAPILKPFGVTNPDLYEIFKLKVIEDLFDVTKNQQAQVEWIEYIKRADNAHTIGELVGMIPFEAYVGSIKFTKNALQTASKSPLISRFVNIIKNLFVGTPKLLTRNDLLILLNKTLGELDKVILNHRNIVKIFRNGVNERQIGGTVASGKIQITGLSNEIFLGASSNAQAKGEVVNQRYKSVNPININHAEQDMLGKIADHLDFVLGNKSKTATGEILIKIEQKMCSSCASGLKNSLAANGIIKQFSLEYQNINLVIDDSFQQLVIKNGQILK